MFLNVMDDKLTNPPDTPTILDQAMESARKTNDIVISTCAPLNEGYPTVIYSNLAALITQKDRVGESIAL